MSNSTDILRFVGLILCVGITVPSAVQADGPGQLKFDESTFEVVEESGVAVIRVERSRGEDGAISVDYEALAGSATDGSDFVATNGTLTWNHLDEDTKTFEVEILDDNHAEGGETIQLQLSNPTGGATLHPERFEADLVILTSDGGNGGDPGDDGDDPGVLKFDEDETLVDESAGVVTVVVERSQGGSGVVSVDYSTVSGTATSDSDYTAVSGTLVWSNADEGNQSFSVPIIDDSHEEWNESFEVVLSNPTGGAQIDPLRDRSSIVILANDGGTGGNDDDDDNDEDGPGRLKFDETSFEVLENSGIALIRVERSGGGAGEVSVDYETVDGSATSGLDYTTVTGTLTWFDRDETARTFAVPIIDDDDAEGDETVHLLLSNPTNGAEIDPLAGTSQIVIIANDGGTGGDTGDDDRPGTLKFAEDRFFVAEEAGIALITVERSRGESGVVTAEFSTSEDSALDGLDFSAVSGTLSWSNGDGGDHTFVVPILDDFEVEGNERILLDLHNATGGASIDPERGVAELIILASDGGTDGDPGNDDDDDNDGDPGLLKFSSGSFQVLESAGLAIVSVERSQGNAGPVSVGYRTLDDSALQGEDYSAVEGTLSWSDADETTKSFAVPILDDSQTEGNEIVRLELVDPIGATLDPARSAATLTVIDDDSGLCTPDTDTMCLAGGRFRVEVSWTNFEGQSGSATPVAISDGSGLFWFFDRNNVEMLAKVLNGCSFNQHFWVFASATTDVGVELTITDTFSGTSRTYSNPAGRAMPPIVDTEFFACQ